VEAWKRNIPAYKVVLDDSQPDGMVLSNVEIIFADLTLSSAIQLFGIKLPVHTSLNRSMSDIER